MSTYTPCIKREFLGGHETIDVEEFAAFVIQDDEAALSIIDKMLAGDGTYIDNEDEPGFTERYAIVNEAAAEAQRRKLAGEPEPPSETAIHDLAEEFDENGLHDAAEHLRLNGVESTCAWIEGEIEDARRNDDPEGWYLGNLEVARDRLANT